MNAATSSGGAGTQETANGSGPYEEGSDPLSLSRQP